jgi:hypothetical protein
VNDEERSQADQAFRASWMALETAYRNEARFAEYLKFAQLVDYQGGMFRIALPSETMRAQFSRRQETRIVKDMLALYMPVAPINVEFVVEGGQS